MTMPQPALTVKDQSISTATAYRFVFSEMGWAIFTVNDETGEFQITSDWGNYSYRWMVGQQGKNLDGTNKTLTEFLALQVSPQYVLTKMSSEGFKALDRDMDSKATRKQVLDHVREHNQWCRPHGVKRNGFLKQAGLITSGVKELNFDSQQEFIDSVFRGDLEKFLEQPWEYIQTKPSCRWEILEQTLLPFFFGFLRERLKAQEAEKEARKADEAKLEDYRQSQASLPWLQG
jgi:hypothetical protein